MNNTKYFVQKAKHSDAECIAQFQIAMALETENLKLNLEVVTQGVKRIFNEPIRGFYIIAKDEANNPVGSLLILKEWSDWRNADVWWIHSVYILPTLRGQGIFSKMFTFIEKLARKSGVKGIRLYVDKKNEKAKAVYVKLNMNSEHYELFEKMFE